MGATDTFGFPFPDETDLVMDGSQAIQDFAETVDSKLSNETLECTCTGLGEPSDPGDWTISNFIIRRSGLLTAISGAATRTVADLTVPASGNIAPNNPVATLNPAGGDQIPLPAANAGIGSGNGGRLCGFYLDPDGVLWLSSCAGGGGDIAVGDQITFNGIYIASAFETSD